MFSSSHLLGRLGVIYSYAIANRLSTVSVFIVSEANGKALVDS